MTSSTDNTDDVVTYLGVTKVVWSGRNRPQPG